MKKWFKRSSSPPALRGAPAVRRLKTYSAETGYVYQYFYESYRAGERETEFVFDVSADRKTSSHVSVFVSHKAIAAWQNEHGRELTSTEQYAIAKMALFQAFDHRENPEAMKEEIRVRAEDVQTLLAALDID